MCCADAHEHERGNRPATRGRRCHALARNDTVPIAIIGQLGNRNRRYHHASYSTYRRYEIQTTAVNSASRMRASLDCGVLQTSGDGTARHTSPAAANTVSADASQVR
jgi:hypothetical protein